MQSTQSYGNDAFVIDEGNFSYLFDKYYAAVAFFANRLLKNRERAEDIVSEVFFTLWQKRAEFNAETPIKAFLYTTTRQTCFGSDQADFSAQVEITRSEVLRELYYRQQTHKQ
ncbi:MAG TPA: sigma factor [Chitinophagaceae bacterium]|nr:sigma factor [Chitinophagaceae bacterium]